MTLEHDQVEMALMRQIKRTLDPNNIMNQGKEHWMDKYWNNGIMESWNIGLRRKRFSHYSIIPIIRYSVILWRDDDQSTAV